MKRFFILFALILSFTFSGCSIAIIGGSDGPTSIKITDNKSEKENLDLIKVNNSIYYEIDNYVKEPYGNYKFKGKLSNDTTSFEVPKENNKCNFNDGIFYEVKDEETIYVLYNDNDVEVFKKVKEDVSKYKYGFVIEEEINDVESEYMIFTNDMSKNKVSDYKNSYVEKIK